MARALGVFHPSRERAGVGRHYDRSRFRRESREADELLGKCAEHDNPPWMFTLYPPR
jgi:hypothetical protein